MQDFMQVLFSNWQFVELVSASLARNWNKEETASQELGEQLDEVFGVGYLAQQDQLTLWRADSEHCVVVTLHQPAVDCDTFRALSGACVYIKELYVGELERYREISRLRAEHENRLLWDEPIGVHSEHAEWCE